MRGTVPLFTLEKAATGPDPAEAVARLRTACLVRIYPAGLTGSRFALTADRMVLGRSSTCHFEMNDDHASREHAAIEVRNARHWIKDLGSLNGTFVNDSRIESTDLKSGDLIRIGHHIFKYLCSDDVEAMYHEAVFQMMTMDGLTQTYNRRYFEDAFAREVLRANRHRRPLGLMILDLDHFKELNDRFGHLVGDEVLASVCRRIKRRVRSDEIFARIGGEEFALVVVETSRENVLRIGEQLLRLVSDEPFQLAGHSIRLTLSVGAAHSSGQEPVCMKTIWNQADTSLYEAKRLGRNRIIL